VAKTGRQLIRGILGDNPAAADDDNPLADRRGFRKNMRAQDHGMGTSETLDQLPNLDDLFGIEPDGWFVQNQYGGIMKQCLRQPDSLTISAREIPDHPMQDRSQTKALDLACHGATQSGARQPAQSSDKL
jgi:hypothetical protein